MISYFGDFAEDDTVLIPFNTFSSDDPSASVTITDLADADIHVHKDGNATEAVTDGATVAIDFDGITGNHLITIDTSADAFYVTGSEYQVRVEGTTVDAATINAWVGSFSIERAGGALALAKLIQAAVITNAAGADIAADIIAVKAETANILVDTGTTLENRLIAIEADTDVIDDGTSGLVKIASDVAAVLVDTGTTIPGTITTLQADTDDIQTRLPAALVGGLMSSDVTAISTDTNAADNLELQFDGTGVVGDTFPSTQSQLSGIANVGAAVSRTPSTYVLTTGTQSSGTIANVAALDGTNHEHTDTAGVMELYYEFNVGAGIPTSATVTGYLNGVNDSLDVYGYDWVATAWVQIGTLVGKTISSNDVNSYEMFTDMVGTGVNSGLVRVRFYAASGLTTATLAVDQIFCSFAQGSSGYEMGAVWIDTTASNTNTVVGIDGTATNPVSTIAAANTIAAATNLNKFEVAPGSTITLAASQANQIFNGGSWTLELGGQDISNTVFSGCEDISGIGTTATGEAHFDHCTFDGSGTTLGISHFDNCGFAGTLTLSSTGDYVLNHCYSEVAGGGAPVFDFGAAVGNTNLNMRDYSGGVQIDNKDGTGTDLMSLEGNGQLIVSASSSGAISLRGNFSVTNTGGATITYDDNAQTISDLNLGIIYGTAAPGTLSTTVCTSDLTGYLDDELIGRVIIFTGGTANGQASDITDYAAASGTVTYTAIPTAPANGDTFKIV